MVSKHLFTAIKTYLKQNILLLHFYERQIFMKVLFRGEGLLLSVNEFWDIAITGFPLSRNFEGKASRIIPSRKKTLKTWNSYHERSPSFQT